MQVKYTRWLRSYVGHQRIMQVRAGGFVRNDKGEIMLCRRADVMLWDVPGGTIELNETPAQGLVREVRDETGLIIEPKHLIGIYGGPEFAWSYPNGDQAQILVIYFRAEIVDGHFLRAGHENVNVAFFPPDQLPPLISRSRRLVSDGLAERREAIFE